MGPRLRLLLVDRSELTAWVVRRLAPSDVEVQQVTSFEEAHHRLAADPPDAAIFTITPSDLPWQELARKCRDHRPPIPVLWCSTVVENARELYPGAGDDEALCHLPVDNSELRRQLEALIRRARNKA